MLSESSYRTVSDHWGELLGCDPALILADGVTVTPWEREAVEFLLWDGGAALGAPRPLVDPLRDRSRALSLDLTVDGARELVTPPADVEEVLGPQFVGYCDRSAFDPAAGEARQVDPGRLGSLRDACPAREWERGAMRADDTAWATFAVLVDGQPVAASQVSPAHGVAGTAVVTHPDYRGRGHGTAAVSRAFEAAFERGLLPEYRTVERWSSSVALAEGLGVERVARSILVRLSDPS